MAAEKSTLPNPLAEAILASGDIREFFSTYPRELTAEDVQHLKAAVDQMAARDFNKANELAEAAWVIANNLGDAASRANAEAALGRVKYCQGNYSQALTHYQQAIDIMASLNRPVEVAVLQKQLVGVLMYLSKHQEASLTAASARQIFKQYNEQAHLAELETNIGNLHCYLLNQYRKSLHYYEKALGIFQQLGNEVSCAHVEYNLANALTELDRIDEALALYQRASQIYRKHAMSIHLGQTDYNIAYLLFRRGQFNEALKYYYQVRETQQGLGNMVSLAWCNMDMAEIYLQLSAFEESVRLAREAHQHFLNFGNTFKAALAQMLAGLALVGLDQIDEAREELSKALEEFSRQSSRVMVGLIHTYLASLELETGNYQIATANAQAAERIFVSARLPLKAATARLVLARLAYLTNDQKRASKLLRLVEQAAHKHAVIWLQCECHCLRGNLCEAAGDNAQALAHYDRAIEMIREVRSQLRADELKSTFLRDKLALFDRTIELSLDLEGDYGRTLYYIEQAKSRSLADLLAHYVEREVAVHLIKPELQERFVELLNELNWYASSITAALSQNNVRQAAHSANWQERRRRCEQEMTELFRRIQIEHSEYATLQYPSAIDLAELQSQLSADEALIEYFATKGQISAFVITRDEIRSTRHLITEARVEQLLDELQFLFGKFEMGSEYIASYLPRLEAQAKDCLSEFYAGLLKSLSVDRRALIIVPHGLLHYLPFHALYDGARYLIERHEISYAPSATVHSICRRTERPKGGQLLLLGLPDENAPKITEEIAAIAAICPQAQVLMKEAASLDNLKRLGPQCQILHLATHCVVRPDNPLFSYLKLADTELTFYNTFDLKLQAELVTLSACHTGVNRIFPGDELHGLMRGFLYAGTPALITSLWEVDDEATSELMVSFYRRLLDGMPKNRALAEAQREILRRWPHPYYWASFVLMGNTN